MMSRAEVTTRHAKAFKAADKRAMGRILDEVTSVTGWSRDSARRLLAGIPGPGGGWRQCSWLRFWLQCQKGGGGDNRRLPT